MDSITVSSTSWSLQKRGNWKMNWLHQRHGLIRLCVTYSLHLFVLAADCIERIGFFKKAGLLNRRGRSYHGAICNFDEVVYGAGQGRFRGGRWGGGGRRWQRNEFPHLKQEQVIFWIKFISWTQLPKRIAIRYGCGRAGCLLRRGRPSCPPDWYRRSNQNFNRFHFSLGLNRRNGHAQQMTIDRLMDDSWWPLRVFGMLS